MNQHSRPKIGFVSAHTFIKPGGVKNHILGLRAEFTRKGFESKIILPRRSSSEDYGDDTIFLGRSFSVPFGGAQGDLDINFDPFAIERVLKQEKFDILHFHNLGLPWAAQLLARSKSLNILTFHSNINGSKLLKTFPMLMKPFGKIVQWKIDGLIGVAPMIMDVFANYHGPKKVIPNGINTAVFSPSAEPMKKFLNPEAPTTLLFVGRVEDRKGLIYLLQAYEILQEKFPLRLIVVGEGPLMPQCQDFVRARNLRQVHFEGAVYEPDKVAKYFASADIYCSPAIYGESFGIVLLEGMASGKPVVGFANEGYIQLLQGTKGELYLAKPRDHVELAKKLELLIKSKELRQEMGGWGIKEAMKYSWPVVADQVIEFYDTCQKHKDGH